MIHLRKGGGNFETENMTMMGRSTFDKLAQDFSIVPVSRRIPADTETPVSTYLKVARGPWSFLLESVEGGTRWGRYSIVGFDPFAVIAARGNDVTIQNNGVEHKQEDPRDSIRSLLSECKTPKLDEVPRFAGGLVGYMGYGVARLFEELPGRSVDPLGLPDIKLFAPKKLLAFDNVSKTLDVIVLARPAQGENYDYAVKALESILSDLRTTLPAGAVFPSPTRVPELRPAMTQERFEAIVTFAREAIHSGEAIQVVLSQVLEAETDLDPFTVYRALRALNPSPYMFHIAMDKETLVGSSPEVMVRVEGRKALVRPIAGTRPRGKDPSEDVELEEELLADAKERAEHVMLVDLGRNDLGRVAQPGAVTLEESFVIERYSHVMHMVSTVSATLSDQVDCLDVLAATFPAGTVSGAPKVRAMELIAELEGRERSVYAGAVGYLAFDGNMDTCIAIRTMVFNEGKVYLQAGAGIVADSDPTREYQETLHKAKGPWRALEVAAAGLT